MGNPKQKWTSEEEDALRAGVAKHGTGKWKNILRDPEFAPSLTHRSNIDLKDKWRNMSVNIATQGSKEKSKVPKVKATTNGENSSSAASLADDEITDDPSKTPQDGKAAPRYNAMIIEALSSVKDSNGSDIGAIVKFIEQKHEVPQNFRRLLSSRLRSLVLQGKLEKVQNSYRIKNESPLGTKTPAPKQKEIRPRSLQNSGLVISQETVEAAAKNAAYQIAEAENKSFVAAEAMKEAERVARMAEDSESLLQLVKEIYEQCSRGEIVLVG
ncbi:Telomere repeat-binding factor like [Actinidia chinensis var. chinensis]|uniref:MYB transcription factor n=1 Tax=Actinidia chinensis var. chinensis TaxID=1590841 RepID=A0A2R6PT70_ACTCC|nr:Telomere repeat-binding factor like [Actinidia chinensis var. chinensis]